MSIQSFFLSTSTLDKCAKFSISNLTSEHCGKNDGKYIYFLFFHLKVKTEHLCIAFEIEDIMMKE